MKRFYMRPIFHFYLVWCLSTNFWMNHMHSNGKYLNGWKKGLSSGWDWQEPLSLTKQECPGNIRFLVQNDQEHTPVWSNPLPWPYVHNLTIQGFKQMVEQYVLQQDSVQSYPASKSISKTSKGRLDWSGQMFLYIWSIWIRPPKHHFLISSLRAQ